MKNICEVVRTNEANYSSLGALRCGPVQEEGVGRLGSKQVVAPPALLCRRLKVSHGQAATKRCIFVKRAHVCLRERRTKAAPPADLRESGGFSFWSLPPRVVCAVYKLCSPGSGVLVTSLKCLFTRFGDSETNGFRSCTVLQNISHFKKQIYLTASF